MEIKDINIFLDYLDKVRARTLKLIAVVPNDKMDWSYLPGKYSIADIIRHIAGMERYMFAENIVGRPSSYKGCGKDLADGYDNVVAYFNELHRQTVEIILTLNENDLQNKCVTPGGTISIWKWLRALIEHEIHHRGELYIYLNLLGVKTPPMFGLTAEEVEERAYKQ